MEYLRGNETIRIANSIQRHLHRPEKSDEKKKLCNRFNKATCG